MKLPLVLPTLAVAAILALPGSGAAQAVPADTVGPDTVVYTPARGAVTFAHGEHAKLGECSACHHASKSEKPLASTYQKCSACHVDEAAAPMKTNRKAAYHNTADKEGTCYTCHKKEAAAGKTLPITCAECHKRAE